MRHLTTRQLEYANLRLKGASPREAYKQAGFSLKCDSCRITNTLEKSESYLAYMREQRELNADTRTPAKRESDRALLQVKVESRAEADKAILQAKVDAVKEAEKEVAAIKITKKLIRETKGKIGKDEIECRLLDLAEKAEAARDLGTARQCYEALGKNIGMFTPVQKIKIETVDDLTLDETETLIAKMMAAKKKEIEPLGNSGVAGQSDEMVN